MTWYPIILDPTHPYYPGRSEQSEWSPISVPTCPVQFVKNGQKICCGKRSELWKMVDENSERSEQKFERLCFFWLAAKLVHSLTIRQFSGYCCLVASTCVLSSAVKRSAFYVFYAAFYWELKGCKVSNWGKFAALGKGLALGTFRRPAPFSKFLGTLDTYQFFICFCRRK